MAIEFNDNIHVKINRPTDFRFGPFISIAQANATIPIAQRYHGLIFGVYTTPLSIATSDIIYYYYWNGLSNTDIKQLGGKPPVDGSYANQAAMIAAQATQTAQYIYYDGTSYWEYLGTTNGNISDYREINNSITNLITGTGASGQVSFWTGTSTQTGDNGLFWDNVNKRLGVRTNAPSQPLDIRGQVQIQRGLDSDVTNFNINSGVTPISAFQINTDQPNLISRIVSRNNYILALGVSDTDRLRIFTTGNVLIQNGGAFTDAGFRLDVAGSTRIVPPADTTGLTLSGYSLTGSSAVPAIDISGTWNTTGTPSIVRMNITDTASNGNSAFFDLQVGGVSRLRLQKDSRIAFPLASIRESTGVLDLRSGVSSATGDEFLFSNGQVASRNATSGINNGFRLILSYAPTSGTGIYNVINLANTINQTGGASGITRGLYVNPTLTSAADWRSIETSNNTGYAAYFAGTADLFFNDATDLQFGTTTGTKIGTSTSQKLGFWNATPIVQPANTVAINDVLVNVGLRASGGISNFTSSISTTGNVEIGGQAYSPVNAKGNSGTGTVTFNWNDGNIQSVTLTGSCTFAFSNPQSGASYQIIIIQDGTGSWTITWPTIHWQGKVVPSLTGTANSKDILTITYDGTNYNAVMAKNFGTP